MSFVRKNMSRFLSRDSKKIGYNEHTPILHKMAESDVIRYMDDDGHEALELGQSSSAGSATEADQSDSNAIQDERGKPSKEVVLKSPRDAGLESPEELDHSGLSSGGLSARVLRSLSLQEDTANDLLGMLSHTPDPYLDDRDCSSSPFFSPQPGVDAGSFSGRYLEVKFNDVMPDVYLRDSTVRLSLLALEPVPTTLHLFNPYRVEVQLEHGDFCWRVHTRLKNITSLHNKLALYRMKLRVPAPTQKGRHKQQSIKYQIRRPSLHQDDDEERGSVRPQRQPSDAKRREVKLPRKSLFRMDAGTPDELQLYLRNMMLHPFFRTHRDVLELFEISALSFVPGLGRKLKEGVVRKRSGGYAGMGGCGSLACCRVCEACSGQYKERWLVLKESSLFFLDSSGRVRGVMLMDRDFQVSNGFRHTGINNGLVITSLSRRLVMMCDSDQSEKDWTAEIRRVQNDYSGDFCSRGNRHNAFAPVRSDSLANWYVDGNRYMWDVADAIDGAQEEVFITDWWLSPDIFMKRPDLTATHWRLSEVLRRAAARGVFVYVLLYKEVEMALGLNSLYSKHTLDKMHPNIKVLRHPDHGGGGTLYWAHHEKLVIIDQQHAFVSGIDLCYGRWDDYHHRLVDLGHGGMQKPSNPVVEMELTVPQDTPDHRSSHSSIAHLLVGTQLLLSTVQQAPTLLNEDNPPHSTNVDMHDGQSVSTPVDASNRLKDDYQPTAEPISLLTPIDVPLIQTPDMPHTVNPSNGSLSTAENGVMSEAKTSLVITTNPSQPSKEIPNNLGCSTNSSYADITNASSIAVVNETASTDLDVTVGDSKGNSLHNIPDIVEEVIKRTKSQKYHSHQQSSGPPSDDDFATSDDELILKSPDRTRSVIQAADTHPDQKADLERVRSISDPVRRSRVKNILYRISHSERKKRNKVSLRREKSLEFLGERPSRKRDSPRKEGVKSDGDLTATEEEDEPQGPEEKSTLNAVRTRGKVLVEGIRGRGSDVKNWTRRKLPTLNRASSINSEADLDSPKNPTRKSASKWRARVRATRIGKNAKEHSESPDSGPSYHQHAPTLYDSPSIHLWVGKDYVNWITKDLNNPDEPFSDSVQRHRTPRMPWHDIGLYVEGPAARDAARHFVQRWNAVKNEKVKSNEKYPFLLPRTYHPAAFRPSPMQYKQRVKCQVVRSVGEWSAGLHEGERSIYHAYHSAIRDAKHYLYIENQFFISLSSGSSRGEVQNRIAAAIVERIIRAHRTRSVFRVFVLLPLLPAFEGQIGTPSGTAMQFILHYTFNTLVRGENSLVRSLEARGVSDWRKYISFSSLRSHDTLDGSLVTELVYIHSKLLIADDCLVIAGSANINDRSMLGDRDSEVALVIEDEDFEDGLMNGKPYKRGLFAGSLRRYLFSEHLGLIDAVPPQGDTLLGAFDQANPSPSTDVVDQGRAATWLKNAMATASGTVNKVDTPTLSPPPPAAIKSNPKPKVTIKDIVDPVCDQFYNDIWLGTAQNNTTIYEEVFSCYPRDSAVSFQCLEQLRATVPLATSNPTLAADKLAAVQGNLVQFPLHFLEEEPLKPGLATKEGLLPTDMWT